ncbi:phosphoserine phosphatase SerB [Propionibacteriaceae bacterium G57]|uniref:phosphoserine phosphatase SerB n=1 Tax=Aestuariimicrobium sp. G57 TaxID=3418485 RepID=UPI003DA7A39D
MSIDTSDATLHPTDSRSVLIGPGLPPSALPGMAGLTNVRSHAWGWSAEGEGSAAPLADHAVVTGWLANQPPKLVVLDVDATLVTGETIDLLAERAGAGEQVAAITQRAMNGELEFAQALAARVETLAGLPVEALDEVRHGLEFSPGARELVEAVHATGGKVAIVSGGFIEIVAKLAETLSIDFAAANTLEVADGVLTGRTLGPVVDRAAKARKLLEFAAGIGATPDQAVAIGDGANDLDMMGVAGLGIAYCAKPAAAAQADATISFPRLDAALGYLQLG